MTKPAEIYGGDLREVFRHPGALIGGVIGTVLAVGLGALLSAWFGGSCEERLRAEWISEEREPFSDAFNAEAATACAEAGDFLICEETLRKQWLAEDKNPYALDYGIALQTACPRPDEEDDFEIPFEAGAIAKLGEEIDPMEKVVIEETREEVVAPEDPPEETVTEEVEVEDKEEKEKPKEPDKKEPKPKPKKPVEKDKKLPTNKKATEKNTPFRDLPTTKTDRGDPFGDAGGWAEMNKDGDPWATAVMKALNNMRVNTFGAQVPAGDFKFQLVLCKDGSIKTVSRKGGSLPRDVQNAVVLALNQLDLPKPPREVSKTIPGSCARLKYTFRWSGRGVR